MKRLAAIVMLAIAAHASAQGGAAETASAAVRAGDYAEAYCIWRNLAERGNAEAQYNLGWLYHNGHGLAVSDQKALDWWEQAAAQEYPEALYALANLYRAGGRGIPKDAGRAIDYLLRAASRGDEESALLLRTLLAKNDPAVRERSVELLTFHGMALGAPLVVRADQAALRKTPAANAPALATLARGRALIELSRKGDWVQAGDPADGRIGWIKATLVESDTVQR